MRHQERTLSGMKLTGHLKSPDFFSVKDHPTAKFVSTKIDKGANGYVRSEGCGVVILQRLSDALRERRTIHALIRGSATNQDGLTNGLTAPSGTALSGPRGERVYDPDDLEREACGGKCRCRGAEAECGGDPADRRGLSSRPEAHHLAHLVNETDRRTLRAARSVRCDG